RCDLYSFPTRRSSDLVWFGPDPMQLDATRTALVKVNAQAVAADATTNVTWAGAGSVNHGRKKVEGARIAADGTSLAIDGVDSPVDRKSTRLNSSHLGI